MIPKNESLHQGTQLHHLEIHDLVFDTQDMDNNGYGFCSISPERIDNKKEFNIILINRCIC